jgi:hypothetical protein
MLIPTSSLGNVASLKRGLRGLGYTPENCGPMDVACVQRNTVNSIAYQDSVIASQISDPTARAAYFARSAAADASNPALTSFFAALTPVQAVQLSPRQILATAAGSPLAPPASAPTPINPGRVSIANTTRPGQQSFYPSDSYLVQITGATPNQQVTAAATQNGKSLGTTPFGNTDSAGNFSITGTMSADQIGNWVEVWMVAGLQSGTASFSVIQSPGATPSPTSQTTTPPDPTAPGGTTAMPPPQPGAPASSSFLSFLQQGFTIGSLTIPFWAVAAGVAGVFVFAGEKGGN